MSPKQVIVEVVLKFAAGCLIFDFVDAVERFGT